MIGTKEILERQILHAEYHIKTLEDREEHLSKHGYWDLGYWKGKLYVLKDWLDELNEEE